jgi:small nuclear ribonucleoprotein (snRNP)-like protein
MGIFSEIRNEKLIRELQRELNTDVLLFGVDGNTYFGNLQAIDDCRIAVLTGATKACNTDVEILTAGGELFTEATFLSVDLWTIVAKGTGIVNDPIDSPIGLQAVPVPREDRPDSPERQESHDLIRRLCRMIGDNVAVATLGGYLFEGILGDVDDELAILAVDDIFVPGTSSSISDDDVRTVVINLEAITAVSSTTTSRS